jgi:splicing factor 3A subunit 3
VDLKTFHSAESLEALGLERLKEGLTALGLKCGGTLQERAARLFSTKGKTKEQIDKKLWAKPSKPAASKPADENNGATANNGNGNGRDDPRRACAWAEQKVRLLADALAGVVAATRKFVEKKQTRTQEELAAEMREEEEGAPGAAGGGGGGGGGGEEGDEEDDDEDEDGPIYNPLNLPLGYDGKPIPYWLYKLHGLSVEYKCEICGNYSYWGRRNFDRHFQVSPLIVW